MTSPTHTEPGKTGSHIPEQGKASIEEQRQGKVTGSPGAGPEKGSSLNAVPAKIRLKDLSPESLAEFMAGLGEKPYRGHQVASWLFSRGCLDFGEMSDISKASRETLSKVSTVAPLLSLAREKSDPSGAKSLLWRLSDGLTVESVLLTEAGHYTLCVSTQVGCRMGCRFCRTGSLGLSRNLTQGEILGQIFQARRLVTGDDLKITNVVFMGMGEPLDNADNVTRALEIITSPKYLAIATKRVSLSTVGVIPQIQRLAGSGGLKGGLTISLGSANNELRSFLMPANKSWPLAELKKTLSAFPLPNGRRLTIAYVLLDSLNDSPMQARELSRFLAGLKTKINLIPFNPWPGAPFNRPSQKAIESFRDVLLDKRHSVQVRDTKGASINAACGLLVADQL